LLSRPICCSAHKNIFDRHFRPSRIGVIELLRDDAERRPRVLEGIHPSAGLS
jgi:hypothetical protein